MHSLSDLNINWQTIYPFILSEDFIPSPKIRQTHLYLLNSVCYGSDAITYQQTKMRGISYRTQIAYFFWSKLIKICPRNTYEEIHQLFLGFCMPRRPGTASPSPFFFVPVGA